MLWTDGQMEGNYHGGDQLWSFQSPEHGSVLMDPENFPEDRASPQATFEEGSHGKPCKPFPGNIKLILFIAHGEDEAADS